MGHDFQDRFIPKRGYTAPRITRIYRQHNHIRILPYLRAPRARHGAEEPTLRSGETLQTAIHKVLTFDNPQNPAERLIRAPVRCNSTAKLVPKFP
jgi:hypothetical protein